MAKNKGRRSSSIYGKPITPGNMQMSFRVDTFTADELKNGKDWTAASILTALGLVPASVDAIKISSVIIEPGEVSGAVNFVEGQRFVASDRMKPTKIVPSALSPAGRWSDSAGTAVLMNVLASKTSSGTAFSPVPYTVNVAVRRY